MHTIYRCTWKSLQFFIIIIMMAWFMRVFQQNALAPSSVYSILPQCLRPHFLSCICVFSFLFTAMHVKSLAFCVWEWRRYSIQKNKQKKNLTTWRREWSCASSFATRLTLCQTFLTMSGFRTRHIFCLSGPPWQDRDAFTSRNFLPLQQLGPI